MIEFEQEEEEPETEIEVGSKLNGTILLSIEVFLPLLFLSNKLANVLANRFVPN